MTGTINSQHEDYETPQNDYNTRLLFPSEQWWVLSPTTNCRNPLLLALFAVHLHVGAVLRCRRRKSMGFEGGKPVLLCPSLHGRQGHWGDWKVVAVSLGLCVCVCGGMCIPSPGNQKGYCLHDHLLLHNNDIEHTLRVDLCEDYWPSHLSKGWTRSTTLHRDSFTPPSEGLTLVLGLWKLNSCSILLVSSEGKISSYCLCLNLVCSHLVSISRIKMAVKWWPHSGLPWPWERHSGPRGALCSGSSLGVVHSPLTGTKAPDLLVQPGPLRPAEEGHGSVLIDLSHIQTLLSYALSVGGLLKAEP